MTTEQLTAEFFQSPVSDVAAILTRYVRTSRNPAESARTLTSAIYNALPNDSKVPRLLKVADFMDEIGEPPSNTKSE